MITSFYQASYDWDYATLQSCVAPEVPVYDPYESAKGRYMQAADSGFMIEADIEKFLDLEQEFNLKLYEQIQYQSWDITVTGDTATVILAVTGASVDFDVILSEDGEFAYRDGMFIEVCGMEEKMAKASLSPEEFSIAHLKVQQKEYQLWLENVSTLEEKMKIQLRKTDGQWRIVNILAAE